MAPAANAYVTIRSSLMLFTLIVRYHLGTVYLPPRMSGWFILGRPHSMCRKVDYSICDPLFDFMPSFTLSHRLPHTLDSVIPPLFLFATHLRTRNRERGRRPPEGLRKPSFPFPSKNSVSLQSPKREQAHFVQTSKPLCAPSSASPPPPWSHCWPLSP